jgi:fumarate hydratase subunit beta
LKELLTPLREKVVKELKAGERVLLSGTVFTARDAAHRRFKEALKSGDKLPFNPSGAVIFYAAPTPSRGEADLGVIGPTTSARLDVYVKELVEQGVKGFIGKGPRSVEVVTALKGKGVYLVAPGGAASYLARFVKKARHIAYEDLGSEAVMELEVVKMPLVVGIDSQGGSVFRRWGG